MRFSLGDRAILALPADSSDLPFIGEVVEIILVGPWPAGTVIRFAAPSDGRRLRTNPIAHDADYLCAIMCSPEPGHRPIGYVKDWQLRRLDEPDEPLSLTRVHEDTLETA